MFDNLLRFDKVGIKEILFMRKWKKDFLNDIHDISLNLQYINSNISGIRTQSEFKLGLIVEKLNLNKIDKQSKKISHPVWLMNQDETRCVLTDDINILKNFILVNGIDFVKYETEEKAKEEFVEICNWIATSNVGGTGIYQLTK
jgi:hypothetical protein